MEQIIVKATIIPCEEGPGDDINAQVLSVAVKEFFRQLAPRESRRALPTVPMEHLPRDDVFYAGMEHGFGFVIALFMNGCIQVDDGPDSVVFRTSHIIEDDETE